MSLLDSCVALKSATLDVTLEIWYCSIIELVSNKQRVMEKGLLGLFANQCIRERRNGRLS
jgi:hypothetical protein